MPSISTPSHWILSPRIRWRSKPLDFIALPTNSELRQALAKPCRSISRLAWHCGGSIHGRLSLIFGVRHCTEGVMDERRLDDEKDSAGGSTPLLDAGRTGRDRT